MAAKAKFTYTFTRNSTGSILTPVLRSDGQKVDKSDADFMLYLTALNAAPPAPSVATLSVVTGQSAAQIAAAAAAKTFAADSTKSDHDRIVALETALGNILATGVI